MESWLSGLTMKKRDTRKRENKKIPCRVCGNPTCYYNNKSGLCAPCFHEIRRKSYIEKWLNGNLNTSALSAPRVWIRKYILDEQDNRCDLCGTGIVWNDKPLLFVCDHIDGNASNDSRVNLRLICPNCDSQLNTFKSKNKNSARKR